MYRHPKFALGLLLLIFLFSIVTFNYFFQKKASTFDLSSAQNRFNLQFGLTSKDSRNFWDFLAGLNIPSAVSSGISFAVEGTSSAALAFASPIKGTMDVASHKVDFVGQMNSRIFSTDFSGTVFKFPDSLNLAIASQNLVPTASSCIDLPPEVSALISKESIAGLQYLGFFDPQKECVLIFNTGNFDIDSFVGILDENNEPLYKEETIENTRISLIKRAAIFQIGQWTFVSSSLESAKKVLEVQKREGQGVDFPMKELQKLDFALLFADNSQNPVPEELLASLFGSKNKIKDMAKRTKRLELTVSGENFWGSIEAKQ